MSWPSGCCVFDSNYFLAHESSLPAREGKISSHNSSRGGRGGGARFFVYSYSLHRVRRSAVARAWRAQGRSEKEEHSAANTLSHTQAVTPRTRATCSLPRDARGRRYTRIRRQAQAHNRRRGARESRPIHEPVLTPFVIGAHRQLRPRLSDRAASSYGRRMLEAGRAEPPCCEPPFLFASTSRLV